MDKDAKQPLPQVDLSWGQGVCQPSAFSEEKLIHSCTFRSSVPSTQSVPGAMLGAVDLTASKADMVPAFQNSQPQGGDVGQNNLINIQAPSRECCERVQRDLTWSGGQRRCLWGVTFLLRTAGWVGVN